MEKRKVNNHVKAMPVDFDKETFTAPFFKTDHANANYLGDHNTDNLMLIVYGLATELWAEKERSRVVQGLLSRGKKVTEEAIQKYQPSDAEKSLWQTEQDTMTRRIFSCLGRDTSQTRSFSSARFSKNRHTAE